MFMSAGSPFYQSSELMYLERIPESDYGEFIKSHFHKAGREIDDDSLQKIFRWTRLHTWYVQYVCSIIYEQGYKNTVADEVNRAFHRIMTDFEPQYINYRNLLSAHQFRLLIAIAAEEGVDQPTAGGLFRDTDSPAPAQCRCHSSRLQIRRWWFLIRVSGRFMMFFSPGGFSTLLRGLTEAIQEQMDYKPVCFRSGILSMKFDPEPSGTSK